MERQGRGKSSGALLLGNWCGLGEGCPHPEPPSRLLDQLPDPPRHRLFGDISDVPKFEGT